MKRHKNSIECWKIKVMRNMYRDGGIRDIERIAKKTKTSTTTVRKYLDLIFPNFERQKRKYKNKKTKTYSFKADRNAEPFLIREKKRGASMSKFINSAIWWKGLTKHNPKQALIRLKKQYPALFKFINRKYGKGKSDAER